MDYKQFHLLIAQELNTMGIFTERANLFEQIDRAVEHVVIMQVNELMNLEVESRSAIQQQIADALSTTVHADLVKGDGYYQAVIPSSFLTSNAATITLATTRCTVPDKGLGYYKAIGVARYNGKTYADGSIVLVTSLNLFERGTFEMLKTKEIKAVVLRPEEVYTLGQLSLLSGSLPRVAFDKNTVKVYYEKKDTIPVKIHYYALQALPETGRLSWCKKVTLNMPENIQHYLIPLIVAHIIMTNQPQSQQKLVNFKTELL